MDNFVDKINIARKESKVLAGLKGSKKYKEIKINLLVNLENQGIADQIMIDLVEEYMSLWITSKLLTIDIEKRGVSQTYNNVGGQRGRKSNDSIELLVKVSKQMVMLLGYINFNLNDDYNPIDEL